MEKIRRYDLDWLRVIVFGLLIFYHVGMFFVPWGWHIKNNIIYSDLRWPMVFVNQWRLPILFVISGMGTAYALSFRSGWQFIKERYLRLGIPLFFGMLLIVPPQVYIERIVDGDFTGSYLDFLMGPAYDGIYPAGNFSWHHLWFLPYLFFFSLLLVPVFLQSRKAPNGKFLQWIRNGIARNPFKLYWFVVPLYFCEAMLEPFFPVTHALVGDWFTFVSSMFLFFYGFVLISVQDAFWKAVATVKQVSLVIGIVAFSLLAMRWLFVEDSTVIHFTEALVKVVNFWAWILAIFGYAAKYLNRSSNLLSYCNRAVYPFYILHQTITIIIAYFLIDLEWGFWSKFIILTIGTFGGSWLIYEFLIRRVFFLRPVFGLKKA